MSIWSRISTWFSKPAPVSIPGIPEEELRVPDEVGLKNILRDLERVAEIMTNDGEDNFIRGVRISIDHLQTALATPSEVRAIFGRAADTCQSMWGCMGSLSEFYVTRGAAEKVAQLQSEYDLLTKRIRLQLFTQRA